MKNLIYLVQGKAELLINYLELKGNNNADVLLLSYDKPLEEGLFLPNSTWAEGRNLLLDMALKSDKIYEYYIFLDDDVSFIKGSFELFEKQLLELKPSIAVPVFTRTRRSVLAFGKQRLNERFINPICNYQLCYGADAQFIAFHKDVISDNLVVPLQTNFDDISWHFTSLTQQLLIHNLYQRSFLQFNNILVRNDMHRNYQNDYFFDHLEEWFEKQFNNEIINPRPFALNLFSIYGIWNVLRIHFFKTHKIFKIFFKTLYGTLKYKKRETHSLSQKKIKKILKDDSYLLDQYLSNKVRSSP